MAQTQIPDPPAGVTESDEEQVLAELYGPPCEYGVYHSAEDDGGCVQ